MKISVATVCFNSALSIEHTIHSVLCQTFDNIEFVIVDGGSTDGTIEILNKYSDRIVSISEPDKGVYDAMNKALKMATGDFLIFLGSDDHFVSSDVLERMANLMVDNSTIYYGNVLRPLNMDIYCGRYNKYKLAVKNISHQALFYPRSVYQTKQYNLEYRIFADYVYNMQLWKKVKFQYVPVIVSYYNESGLSSTSRDKAFENDYAKLRRENLGLLPLIYSVIYHHLRRILKG